MKIRTSLTQDSLRIDVPISLLEYLSSNIEGYETKITNRQKFLEYMKNNIIDNYSGDEQWSDFEMLLEEVVIRSAEKKAGLEFLEDEKDCN